MISKINILLCETFPGMLPPSIPSYESMFMKLFDSVKKGLQYKVFLAFKGEFPTDLHKDELYLISGSLHGAYEDIPWINELKNFVRKARKEDVKLVGICFGHQVIAEALGGKVIKSPKGLGAGIRELNICDEKAQKYFKDGKMKLHYFHNDQVIKLPEGAKTFLTDSFCEIGGFTIGDHILTFQGHPEFTDEFEEYFIKNHLEKPEEFKKVALESMKKYQTDGKLAAEWILNL